MHCRRHIVLFVILHDRIDVKILELARRLLSLLHPVAYSRLIFFLDVGQVTLIQDLRKAPPAIQAAKFGLGPTRVDPVLFIVVLRNLNIKCHHLMACVVLLLLLLISLLYILSFLLFLSFCSVSDFCLFTLII